ncbi:glycosyl hydrolase [Paenibacillus cucumis Kampfer et al. 2016]|uniref:Glycosyl hydrolase n=1 Tax=Paenibacillus cucumis (ex Kampfer et al. 2016) TaxID=1776858 RepID=A0ABS7KN94_9BACL|nr:glycosyl hydrolase [Paenibacillus cucumis (ex Kampfer et al. 2016)]
MIKRTLWIRPTSKNVRSGSVAPSYIPVRRNGVKFIFRKKRSWYILLAIVVSVAIVVLWRERFVMEKVSPTVAFVKEHMTNPNGTLATYLQEAASERADIVAGREALSESLGLWMQYALASDNEDMFEQAYKQLQTYYVIRPDIYIAWKLDPQGKSHVATNALGDDLRIMGALLQAADRWNQGRADKLATASALSRTLTQRTEQQGYLVDFYDFKSGHSTDTLSLVYVDLLALEAMRDHQMLDPEVYSRYEDILHKMPDDGLFYPKSMNVNTKAYTYDEKVNLIDQLIVANHVMEMGHKPDKLIAFLKKEFGTRGKLPGQYDRRTQKPAVDYESAAVYGLSILLAVRSGDPNWAKQLYQHMITLRGQDTRYPGGYVFDGNTHLFDNLFPLLGETYLYNFLKK